MNRRYLGLGLLLFLAYACGDSTSSPVPQRLVVSPPSSRMDAVGETLQYSGRLEDKKGKELAGVVFTWSTTDPTIATVSSSGMVTGLKAGSVSVRATAEGITGSAALTIDPIPDQLTKIAGDEQLGALRQILPTQPTVEVQDANGNPVVGLYVNFSVVAGGGTVSPWQVQTGSDGRASTVWQLGCSNDNPQRLEAKVAGLTVSFNANVDLSALAICKDLVPEGRETHPYSTAMEAAGGDQTSLSWTVSDGELPPGLSLKPAGELSGTPTLAGGYAFQARVQDAQGAVAFAQYNLRICDAPILLAQGESRSVDLSNQTGCGFFLPSGADGDRYRFGVVYTRSDEDSENDVPLVTVATERDFGGGVSSEPLFSSPAGGAGTPAVGPRIAPQTSIALQGAMETARATQEFHQRIRLAEQELIRSFGPQARPLPDQRALTRSSGPTLASPEKFSFTNSDDFTNCTVAETVRAIKVKENDMMVIYQDSIQRASDALSDTHAQWMLDHYSLYGKQVIDSYFGGVSDINGDGKVVVFVTPVVEDGVVAFVWSGDFFPKTTEDRDGVTWFGCAASNEMEMMRFNHSVIKRLSDGDFQALGTVVHETKHISSLYKSIIRSDYFSDSYQPGWVEEGTAEFAEEVAARIAWAGAGGPEVGAMAMASDVTAFTRENYSVILVNAGTTGYLSSQPNGIVVTPNGAQEAHSVYGSGWHFHRWLGDAYGNAATPLADASFFRALNDSLSAAGVAGVLAETGVASWADLLEEYITAIMLNGTDAPMGTRAFTSYDFPSMNRSFNYTGKPDGDYPWPVNVFPPTVTAPFSTATGTGPIGPSGVRIFDLTSNGTGLGLDVKVTTGGSSSTFRIVLVRVE